MDKTKEDTRKKLTSIRLSNKLVGLLADVRAREDSFFYDRSTSWLIEYAIETTYGHLSGRR